METPPGRIVGRAAERQVLARVLSEAERGVSGVVVVEGEAGIGKTRLVAELLAQARNLGLPTLTGSGDAVERAAYHGWRDIVAALLGLDPTADAATQARQARQALQPQDQERAPLLRDVLPLELPEDDLTRQMTGQVRADNTRRLLVGLMQAASAGAPKVVVLEDAHWLDSASWALALQVSQQVGPLLLVVVQRPMSDPWPPEYADLLTGAGTLRLQLGPLPADDGRALVCQRLGVTSLPEAVAVLIQSRAEGNPFFSQELGYALRDAGLIQVIDGTCRLAPDVDLTQLAFPDTVQGVITSRIDRLMPTQQLTLKVASVIGRIFAYRLLRAIYPVEADKPQLGECLQALERLDLTALESAEPDLAYIFKHIITQEVAYNLMLFAQRQALHQAIVDWHERTTGDLTPIYPLLAYHCSKAEMPAKAIDYLEKAGEQAAMRYANREAIDLFSRALALEAEAAKAARGASVPGAAHPKDGRLRRARWERQLGQATMGTGDLLRARGHLRNALKLLGRPEAQGPVGLVLGLLGQGLRQTLHRLRPGRWVGRLEDGADAEAVREAAGAYEHLGEIYYLSNDTLRMVHAGLRTLNLAERLAPSPLLARAYGIACVIAGAVPVHGLARAYGRRARQVVRRQSHLPSLTLVLLANGLYHIGVGDWARAENGFRQALEIADRLGDRSRWAENLILTEQVQYFRGSYARGAELADDLAAQAATSGNRLHQAWALSGRAESWLRLGRTAEAAADLIAALTLYSENSDRTSEITSYGLLALAQLRQGDASAARQAAESGAERMAALGSPTSHYLLEGYAGVAETFLMLWENLGSPGRHPFYKSARQACSALKGYARIFPIGQPRAWVCQGWLDWQRGRASRARRAWTRALTAAERLGMPYELGWAHYQFGRHLPAADPARRLHLARACEAFARLGATGDLERARAEAS